MSPTLLNSSKLALPRPSFQPSRISVRNAARKVTHSDPQNELIRRVLYPSNVRKKETPTGTWRPDVAKALRRAIPSKQAHETIERAWLLHERHLRWKRNAEAERKLECMRKAMTDLEKVDPALFKEACRIEDPRRRTEEETEHLSTMRGAEKMAREGRLPGLFPRELRLPADTPPRTGWDYGWRSSSPSSQ